MSMLLRRIWLLLLLFAILAIAAAVFVGRQWQEHGEIADLGWPFAIATDGEPGSVAVTWFGISTLLFDDGETQIMIDGAFTRVDIRSLLTLRRVSSDLATINSTLAEHHVNRLAAIVPVHSHFDHAMDIGHIANRTSAVILGSESSAFIARGADVPVDQYQILANGESRQFGNFTITLIESRHAPIGLGGKAWLSGEIEGPLVQPARITAWREGVSYSVLIAHPRGTTLVQGSGGFIAGNLRGVTADVVMLSIAGLAGLGQQYVDDLWSETVTMVGARRVYPIHYEDFTKPLGEITLFPDFLDNVVETARWIKDFAANDARKIDVQLLPYGEAIVLY
jgi:L-ascorbate metabolism protein UlaG (beta-lactamase superfamily)